MKRKKMYCVILLIAVVIVAAYNMNIHSDKIKLTDVFLDNVEALAQESDNPPECVPLKGVCIIYDFSTDYLTFK